MNDIFLNFDDAAPSFDALPAGDYVARAIKMEVKDTKNGQGKLLKVQFQVVDGPHANRIIFEQFNIVNPNRQAVQISVGQIRSWIEACTGHAASGQVSLQNILAMEGQICVVGVKIERGDHGEQNRIARYKAAPGYSAPPQAAQGYQQRPQTPQAQAPAYQQPQTNTLPWKS